MLTCDGRAVAGAYELHQLADQRVGC